MSTDEMLAKAKEIAEPKLKEIAADLQARFKQRFTEFLDKTKLDQVDDLLKQAGELRLKAVMTSDAHEAMQYARSSDAVLRQLSLMAKAEEVVAARAIGKMLKQAATALWDGFQTVATELLGVLVQGLISGALGSLSGGGGVGGALADAAGGFLGGGDND